MFVKKSFHRFYLFSSKYRPCGHLCLSSRWHVVAGSRNFRRRNFCRRNFRRRSFRRSEFLPIGIFADRNFRRMEILPKGISAERNFPRQNFSRTEVSPKISPKLNRHARREVDDNHLSVNIERVRNTNSI